MNPLRTICLNLIVEEFERFHFAFSESKNETLIKNFDFLRRKYPAEILFTLSEKSQLKDEYLDFLLNIHLRVLREEWFRNSRYRDSMKDVICGLHNLIEVNLPEICSDEILEKIASSCLQVAEIDASDSSVTDIGLKYLCVDENGKVSCPNLKNIFLKDSKVTDEGVGYLIQNLPSLEIIEYDEVPKILYSIYKEEFHNLEKVPTYNLIHLDIHQHCELPYYTDLLKICLTVCPKLKTVNCYITEKKELDLFKSNHLENLGLFVYGKNLEIDINEFLKNKGRNLVSLDVHSCIISVNVLASNCPKLQYLNFSACIFSEDPDDSKCVLKCLTECDFWYIEFDNVNNKALNLLLSDSPNLESLSFDVCQLSPETEIHILKCCEKNILKYIVFSLTYVSARCVKDIVFSSSVLKELILRETNYEPDEWNNLIDLYALVGTLPNELNFELH